MSIKDFFTKKINYGDAKVNQSLSSLVPKVESQVAPAPAQYNLKDRGVQISDADINSFRPLLYGEISNRAPDKQALESNVIFNTALNRVKAYNERGQKKTLSDVLAMPNQYQAYGGKEYNIYNNPDNALSLAKKKQVDALVDSLREQVRTGKYADNTEGSYYYVHNPDGSITYDNIKPLFAK